MEEKSPFFTDKPLYDRSIKYDISDLPKELKEYIKELKELDKIGDWFNYDIKFDDLDLTAKAYLRHHKISSYDYKMILAKYGGIYD